MKRPDIITLNFAVILIVLLILIAGLAGHGLIALLLASLPITLAIFKGKFAKRAKKYHLPDTEPFNRLVHQGLDDTAFREEEAKHYGGSPRFSGQRDDGSQMTEADVVFEKWTQIEAESKTGHGERVFIAGSASSNALCTLLAWLEEEGYSIDVCNVLDDVLESFVVSPSRWSYLVIDFDALSEIIDETEIIDSLFVFRNQIPGVVTVLVSGCFDRDDFSTQRLVISDSSLKLPVNVEDLADNLKIARANNSIWQSRQTVYH